MVDKIALALIFIVALAVLHYTYVKAIRNIQNYDAYAWVLAQEAAELLRQGKGIRTNAYIEVTLYPSGRKYSIGVKPDIIRGYAYTYCILSNNTLVKIEVYASSSMCYVREG